MASTEGPARAHDRHGRRRPFSNWMKRLANLKSSNADPSPHGMSAKRSNIPVPTKGKKTNITKNNPYPLSARVESLGTGHLSFSTPLSSNRSPYSSKHSSSASHDSHPGASGSPKSKAPTLSTTGDTAMSDAAQSKAGTSGTAAPTDGGVNSTFSSPAPSVRSMTTTLTTVQSGVTPLHAYNNPTTNPHAPTGSGTSQHPSHFSHQFPSSPPATAVPAHLAPSGHPTTYNSATANNILTDDASILTLASSSKRRRRNSVDTNASIRALAPASMFGGSRESLPLSVLSGHIIDPSNASVSNAAGVLRPGMGGIASAERASLYSSSGAAHVRDERSSYHAGKQGGGDGASVRSGLPLHGRNDSLTNSIGGGPTSPLASPLPGNAPGRVSRRSSGWGEIPDDDAAEAEKEEEVKEEAEKTDASKA